MYIVSFCIPNISNSFLHLGLPDLSSFLFDGWNGWMVALYASFISPLLHRGIMIWPKWSTVTFIALEGRGYQFGPQFSLIVNNFCQRLSLTNSDIHISSGVVTCSWKLENQRTSIGSLVSYFQNSPISTQPKCEKRCTVRLGALPFIRYLHIVLNSFSKQALLLQCLWHANLTHHSQDQISCPHFQASWLHCSTTQITLRVSIEQEFSITRWPEFISYTMAKKVNSLWNNSYKLAGTMLVHKQRH